MSLRPTLTADGTAVRLPILQHLAPVLDELALLYAERPAEIGALLRAHASAVVSLDHAVCSEAATDYARAMLAAQADGTRDALLDGLDTARTADPLLGADDAVTLGTRLTRLAARIRHAQNGTSK